MMRNKVLLWVMVLLIALTGMAAFAMPVHYEQDALTAQAAVIDSAAQLEAAAEGGEAISVQDFQLLSRIGDGRMLIFADGRYMTVNEADMADVIEQVGEARINALPQIPAGTVQRGSDKAAVANLQQALIDAGYLSGAADGSFGGKSASAVSAFQKDMGLEETGAADPLMQLLLASASQAPVSIVAEYDPAMRYAPIVGKTDANLAAISEFGLELKLDDISGEGELGNGAAIGVDASGNSDLDNYFFNLEFALFVRPDEAGEFTVTPAIKLSCECVRRPIMQEIILKSGDLRATVPVGDLHSTLSGPKAIEIGMANLDEAALKVMANAAETGELKFRINCKYNAFDGAADATQVNSVANIGLAGLAM